jgi:hypothetical protein
MQFIGKITELRIGDVIKTNGKNKRIAELELMIDYDNLIYVEYEDGKKEVFEEDHEVLVYRSKRV